MMNLFAYLNNPICFKHWTEDTKVCSKYNPTHCLPDHDSRGKALVNPKILRKPKMATKKEKTPRTIK
jgi:hypothetical protein